MGAIDFSLLVEEEDTYTSDIPPEYYYSIDDDDGSVKLIILGAHTGDNYIYSMLFRP